MRRLSALIGLGLVCIASAANNSYVGSWRTTSKVNGQANVTVNTTNGMVSGYIKDNFSGLGYQLTGRVVNRAFSGFLSSNGRKWACNGTGTYGVSRLEFTLRANSVNFQITAAR